jgi:hypothetical protein
MFVIAFQSYPKLFATSNDIKALKDGILALSLND